jgi:hypothetical protein
LIRAGLRTGSADWETAGTLVRGELKIGKKSDHLSNDIATKTAKFALEY